MFYLRMIILAALCLGSIQADELVVLETLDLDNDEAFSTQFESFSCRVDAENAFWAVYTVTREGWYPNYYVKRYAPGVSAHMTMVGAFYGMGGWFHPAIVGGGRPDAACANHGDWRYCQRTAFLRVGQY